MVLPFQMGWLVDEDGYPFKMYWESLAGVAKEDKGKIFWVKVGSAGDFKAIIVAYTY